MEILKMIWGVVMLAIVCMGVIVIVHSIKGSNKI